MNICVVGQGYVGLPISIHAARAGFQVFAYDVDQAKIEKLIQGLSSSPDISKEEILRLQEDKKLIFIPKLMKDLNISIYIIAVPTPLNDEHKPELKYLQKACEEIAEVIDPKSLVINESTSFIGTLRNFIKPIIDKQSQYTDLSYAVAPERIDPGNKIWNLSNTPRVISGLSDEAIMTAVKFYEKFCENIHIVAKPEIAEASKLLENTFRQVNIALINEMSKIAANFEFSINEAVLAASTKPFGFMPFYPSIGVGGHCIPIDPSYLIHSANQVNVDTKLIELANRINLERPQVVINQIGNYLGKALTGMKIQVVGISYKIDISDTRESPALALISILRAQGAHVIWCDPIVGHYSSESSSPLDIDIDLGLIVTPHTCIDLSVWKYAGTKVLDLSSNSINYGWSKFF